MKASTETASYLCLLFAVAAGFMVVSSLAMAETGTTEKVSVEQATAGGGALAVAVDKANKDGKNVCLLLYKEKNAKLDSFRKVVEGITQKQTGKVEVITADAVAETSADLLKTLLKIEPAKIPVPMLVVVGTNGAVVEVFSEEPGEKELAAALSTVKAPASGCATGA